MFTGIVEELGAVRSIDVQRLVVDCRTVNAGSSIGASIAINGVCLTVVERDDRGSAFDLSAETLARTALHRLTAGAPVNLERPVTLAARLGGHIVQGHVDGVGEVVSTAPDGRGGMWLRVRSPSSLARYTIEKGSIAIDGVSLTVGALHDDGVTIAVIPHTLRATTLGRVGQGDLVNIEVDVIAKYVERLVTQTERAGADATEHAGG